MLKNIAIFTDASVDPKSQVGFGAYCLVVDVGCPPIDVANEVILTRFNNTSSTRIELENLLHALNNSTFNTLNSTITIYTDCQNIIGLPDRREHLEANNYYSRNKIRVKNFELYQQFYTAMDKLNFVMVKVKGHKTYNDKSNIDKIFSVVDKASRKALRQAREVL